MSKVKQHFSFISFNVLLICIVPTLIMWHLPDSHRRQVHISTPVTIKKPFSRNDIYDSLHLGDAGLSRVAYEVGLAGLSQLDSSGDIKNNSILSIVDLSLPSSRKRFFVIDLNSCRLIFNTYVSHGRNSGEEWATRFSNDPRSYESSLGFYVTGETYFGHHGYSLRLNGKEQGINDNASSRGIVIHGASYVNERIASKQGYIGRSEGCPAIPKKLHWNIIEKIKNGTCLFLYSPDKFYETHSKMRLFPTS
ncbi:MAG TPA: murein L,D-transpeptidase catalytic domain family protein [Puia sp.]|nr:murein L,D-transpeptidase catalytic domain family protein [Puia sp.]